MKLTMLCNCTWRFKNFNIDHRDLESCRDAHVELQQRIEALEDDMTAGFVDDLIHSLPTQRAAAPSAPLPPSPLQASRAACLSPSPSARRRSPSHCSVGTRNFPSREAGRRERRRRLISV